MYDMTHDVNIVPATTILGIGEPDYCQPHDTVLGPAVGHHKWTYGQNVRKGARSTCLSWYPPQCWRSPMDHVLASKLWSGSVSEKTASTLSCTQEMPGRSIYTLAPNPEMFSSHHKNGTYHQRDAVGHYRRLLRSDRLCS